MPAFILDDEGIFGYCLVMGTTNNGSNKLFSVTVAESIEYFTCPEEGTQRTRRIWLLSAREIGSDRFWDDFSHFHFFYDAESAWEFRGRVEARWTKQGLGKDGKFPERAFNKEYWHRNNREEPRSALAPFGSEWQAEEMERRGFC